MILRAPRGTVCSFQLNAHDCIMELRALREMAAHRGNERPGRETGAVLKRILPVVCALAMLMAGCAQSVADAYTDFLMNGDFLQRFEVCFNDIERGHESFYTQGELRTLIMDLEEGYSIDDEQAARTTRLFQESAQALLNILEDAASPAETAEYEAARALYDEAWALSVRVRQGARTE